MLRFAEDENYQPVLFDVRCNKINEKKKDLKAKDQ